jgi:hypothetical protein
MTPLEADKLNKELIECNRQCDNKSKMVIDLARDAVKNDQEIEFLKAIIASSRALLWKRVALLLALYSITVTILHLIK